LINLTCGSLATPATPAIPSEPMITKDDVAGLIAVAEFLDALKAEADLETDAPERLRDLAERLSAYVPE
jgi:hypothetical protein